MGFTSYERPRPTGILLGITSAGKVIFRKKIGQDNLIGIRFHKILPGPVPSQALDGSQIGFCLSFNGNRPFIEIPVTMVEGTNFLWTHRRAKETGGLSREREALLSDGLYTIVPAPSPFNEGILVVIFFIFSLRVFSTFFPAAFSSIISNEFVDLFPSFPRLPAGWMVIAIFFLGMYLVL